MSEEFRGKRLISDVVGYFGEDGLWKVTIMVTQKRSLDGVNWESKELSITDINEDFNRAMLSCNYTIQTYLKSVDYDLFNEKANDPIDDIKN